MSQKTQTLLIRPASLDGDADAFLERLGYDKHQRVGDVPFSTSGAAEMWIGSVGDCVMICTPLVWEFFEEEHATQDFLVFRDALLRSYPNASIVALTLQSTIEQWEFALFHEGVLLRFQHGYDGNVLRNEGARLAVEDSHFEGLERTDAEGKVTYRDPAMPEQIMTEDDLGPYRVNAIIRSLTGFSLESRELNATLGTDFRLSDARPATTHPPDASITDQARPWWRFWRS